ncbi:MAG TPA: hypothetical protein VFQ23_19790 [Anaerolineales bacterium]|nr:hypothetical protein [Anaerolineales bacterium]
MEATANRSDALELNEMMARPFRRAVDLIHVITEDFPTYYGSQNLEIETLNTPPRGTTQIVGGPKVTGATCGPSRLIALICRGDDD